MIADSYLQLRDELETAVTGLLKIAGEMRRTTPLLDMLQGFVAEIREPLVVVVLGEAKSGKSSLLNALFGKDFITESHPGCICIYQYGREIRSNTVSPAMRESYLPLSSLRDFKIIDTPGIEAVLVQDRQSIVEFIARADLVLLVFSLTNPWSKSAWTIFDVQNIPLKNFVFVLQQADLREAKEIEIIRRNLEDSATQRLGFIPPIFAVSARDALLTRTTGIKIELPRNYREFEALKEQINLVITQAGGRTHKLRPACQLAQVVLHDIASELRSSVDSILHDQSRLERANMLLHARREQTVRHVTDLTDRINRASHANVAEGLKILREKLSLTRMWRMLGRSGAWADSFAAQVETKLRQSVEEQVENAAQALETELRGLWPQLHDVIDHQLVTDLKQKVPHAIPDFAQQRRELLSSIQRALNECAANKNGQEFSRLLRKSAKSLRRFAVIAVAAAIGALLTIKISPVAMKISGVIAVSAAIAGAAAAFTSRRKMLHAYEAATETRTAEFAQIVAEQFNRVIAAFHESIAEAFQPLSEYCAFQRQTSEPMLRRADELQRTLAGLASRLR